MRGSIQEMYNNIKSLLQNDSLYFALIVVLVGVTSFGLGRWSALYERVDAREQKPLQSTQKSPENKTIPSIEKKIPVSSAIPVEKQQGASVVGEVTYVASKSGSKYHLLWCSGAKTIKEENKIYFKSKEEAQMAGYTPAANCKGI